MKMLGVVYPADVKNIISEAVNSKATSLNLSDYDFETEALTGNMPDGSNLLITVSPESGINGTNIINNGVCENMVLTDGADFGAPYAFTATQATYTTDVNSYRTLVLPFEASVPAEFTASKATSVTGATVIIEKVTSISANSPVLVQGNGQLVLTASNAVVAASGETDLTEGVLYGTYKTTTATEGTYVLQNQNDKIGFYLVEETKPAVKAFRAYLEVPTPNVKAFFFNEDATRINTPGKAISESKKIVYNLAGQRMSKMQKGVNIVNGNKIVK